MEDTCITLQWTEADSRQGKVKQNDEWPSLNITDTKADPCQMKQNECMPMNT